jgi:hypothetical protein
VRRGANWTAAYHLQLTVAAVARPVRSSVVPSASLLLSGLGCCSPRRRLPGGASSRHPAVGRRRRGRYCQDASHGIGRRLVSSMRCPPIRFRRPGSGCPAVRCLVTWGRRPGHPSGVHPSGVRPGLSGRVRLLPPQAVAVRTRSRWPGDRHHRNGSRFPVAAAPSSRSTAEEAGTRATLPRSRWSVGAGGGPGPGWV